MHSQPKNVALGIFLISLISLIPQRILTCTKPPMSPLFFVKFKFPNHFYSLCIFFNALVYINLTIPVQYRGIHVMSAKTPSLLKPPRDASIYLPPLPFPCTSPFPCSVPALLPSAFHQVNNIAPSALYISLHPPPRSTLPSAVAAKKCALQ